MKAQRLLLASLAASGLIVATAHANVVIPEFITEPTPAIQPSTFAAPEPAMVLSPTDLPGRYRNETVLLRLHVDADGRPSQIAFARGNDPHLARQLFPVIAQWQFKPATRDGLPVAANVTLPLRLVDASGF